MHRYLQSAPCGSWLQVLRLNELMESKKCGSCSAMLLMLRRLPLCMLQGSDDEQHLVVLFKLEFTHDLAMQKEKINIQCWNWSSFKGPAVSLSSRAQREKMSGVTLNDGYLHIPPDKKLSSVVQSVRFTLNLPFGSAAPSLLTLQLNLPLLISDGGLQ